MIEQAQITAPVLPLRNAVMFPYQTTPLTVARPPSVAAVEAALASEDKQIALFAQLDQQKEDVSAEDLHAIGTLGIVKRMGRGDGHIHVIVQGTTRVRQAGTILEQPYVNCRLQLLEEPDDMDAEVEALHREVRELASRAIELAHPQTQVNLQQMVAGFEKPLHLAYVLTGLIPLALEHELALLQADSQREALQLLHERLTHELQVLEIRSDIANKAQSQVSKHARERMLREELAAIQSELGEQGPEEAAVAELCERLTQTELPELVRKEAEKELTRLGRMSSASPDYQLTRTYVELILELPWCHVTEDNLDLDRARRILDEDHFNLKEVKERIVEHLAVMKLNPNAKAPILCLVGPPGVGKTSLGQSVARALERAFERMSLGGLHDEAELRGHRRTYIGALPGRIIRAIRRAGSKNPLLMLDEIDKLGRDFRGDPAAALMEILDPAQNAGFDDNYLDLPFDLSKVLFITTANTLDAIPAPLLDRLEILRIPGYSHEEKSEIAKRYLITRQIQEAGLDPAQLELDDEALLHVIRRYTRESGVRELERLLGRLARKVATRVVGGDSNLLRIGVGELGELLGPERFSMESARAESGPGVAAGLAWTPAGGEVLFVETVLLAGSDGLTLTGQLGDVMKESAKAARSYVWRHADDFGIDRQVLKDNGVHIHVPAGATPKDGPSAGVTIVTSLTSAYSNKPVRVDTAMTGEITLSGLVMPVGGIKEKVLAAHRAGMQRIILPDENCKDLEDLPEPVRDQLEFIFVKRIEDVLHAAIPTLAKGNLPLASSIT
jgi:ATP-dependent Lon protease